MTIKIKSTKLLVRDGIMWGESPRWHHGSLYFSDIMGKKVIKTDMQGHMEIVAHVPGMPSGIDFFLDGRLLIVSGMDGKLYINENGCQKEYADICNGLQDTLGINDMVVSESGNAYVGCYGYDITNYKGGAAEGWIALITPDKKIRKVGTDIMCPNGMVISTDGKTLIAADTIAKMLIAWRIKSDGGLAERRVFARMEDGPDGITIDEEGAVWAALPHLKAVVRIQDGGKVTHCVELSHTPLACMLGGPERKTLFIVTVLSENINNPVLVKKKESHIEYVENIQTPGFK